VLKFTINNGKVVIDPTLLMIKEFTDIIDYAKSKSDEDLGNQLLLYVFSCCDLTDQNPIKDIDYRLKRDQAMSIAFKGKEKKFLKKEEALLDSAIDAYNFYNETAIERATLAYDQKIDEIRSLMEETAPEVHLIYKTHMCDSCNPDDGINRVEEVEKYVSNATDLEKFAKLLNEMATYKLKSMETAKKIENTGRVRGNKGSSMIERGTFLKKGKK
jgi:hypothetical protein